MNGTTMLRPAGSVSLYLPKRSTMPARACGMIRTVLTSSRTTNSRIRTKSPRRYGVTRGFLSVGGSRLEGLVHRVDEDGGALHGQHLHGLAGLDGERLVVGTGTPDLAVQLHAAGGDAGDDLGDERLVTDDLAVPELEVGTGVQAPDEVGPDQGQHRHGGAGGDQDLQDEGQADAGADGPGDRADRQHEEDQVEARELRGTQHEGERQPPGPEVVAQPIHASSLSGGASARSPRRHLRPGAAVSAGARRNGRPRG